MGVPKKKKTRSSRNQRRSHHALPGRLINSCLRCQEPMLPHHVCPSCGTYQDKQVLEIKSKDTKTTRTASKKEKDEKKK